MLHYTANKFNKTPDILDMPIRIAGSVRESIVDGPRLRYVLFTQGCPHRCNGCHNPETHDPEGGKLTSTAAIWREIASNPMLRGITFSGGEPFMWAEELAEIGRAAVARSLDILVYTGYTYEKLLEKATTNDGIHRLLSVTNYLIDGPFILEKRDLSLQFRGSSNQRILDITCYPNSTNINIIENFNQI